jgi:predicted outer membrane repeat protein
VPAARTCTFRGNTAGFGGAIYSNGADPVLLGCAFLGNTASAWGGVMYSALGDPTLVNCLLAGNAAASYGGAMHNYKSDPALTNCTLVGNSAGLLGGGIFNQVDAGPVLTNCILWANADAGPSAESAQLYQFVASLPVVNYSCVQGWTGALGGIGNNGADPLLSDPDGPDGVPGTQDDDRSLQPGSPCIDAGDSAALPSDQADLDGDGNTGEPVPLDLAGLPRFADDPCAPDTGVPGAGAGIADMGALEFQGSSRPGDVDGDCAVGSADMGALLKAWGACPEPCAADLDHNGTVDVRDFLILLNDWGS